MDSINVTDLRVKSHIGATEDERAKPQLLSVNLQIATDMRRAGTSDDLSDTVDYATVIGEVEQLIARSRCALLEHLAENIAAHIAAIPGVNGVTVEVAKDAPPIEQEVGCVGVRIERL